MADGGSLLSLSVLNWALALLLPAAALTAILSALMERSGPIQVVVGKDHGLAPVAVAGHAGDRLAHRPDADQQHPHRFRIR